MAEHITASYRKKREETRYKIYITECLRILTENTTHFIVPGDGNITYGTYMKKSWYEPKKKAEKENRDNRSIEEIAADIMSRAGLKFKGVSKNG